jgi:hypothetical protein
VEFESKRDTGNKGNWNHLKIIQTIHEQQIGKARKQPNWALHTYFRKYQFKSKEHIAHVK